MIDSPGEPIAVPKKQPAPAPAAPDPIVVPAKAGLGFYLREAYRAFSREFHSGLARHNITHAQWVLLWFLSQAGSLTPIALSRRAGIQKASATDVIESLRRRKLIQGDRDPDDRRKTNLVLTPAGATLMKELIACAAAANTLARKNISAKDLDTLLRLLQTISGNLAQTDER
jgi:DNA-binding MarR family transcriptional regulator